VGNGKSKELLEQLLQDLEREVLGPGNPNPHKVRELLQQLRAWLELVDEKVRKPK
jgi:hypothetical protein